MPEKKTTYYLYCEVCDFSQDAAVVLPRTPLKSMDELRENVGRFHCSVCGSKTVVIREGD